ncbi:MAG: dihydropteroate synthase [Planctomycetota bacterium]
MTDRLWTEPLPARASRWQLRTRSLDLPSHPLLMAIINVTPDSFSDGGRNFTTQAAVDHALRLVDQGAAILDIGGESTRPYSSPVSAAEELRRVIPVITALAGRTSVPISIDSSKAQVAQEALAAGAEIINDVTGLAGDPAMLTLAQQSAAGLCVMHMQGTPATMQDDPRYADVVRDVASYLRQRRDALLTAGIAHERICLDPGIGFGKSHQHNLTLLAHTHQMHALGCPVLVGHSRKGFIAKVLADKTADRTAGTIGVALSLARQGVQIIRVHDIEPVRQALLLFAATGGVDGQELQLPPS